MKITKNDITVGNSEVDYDDIVIKDECGRFMLVHKDNLKSLIEMLEIFDSCDPNQIVEVK